MKTKTFLTIVAACLLSVGQAFADDDTKAVKSTIKEATVFFRGAELTHTATANLEKGVNEIKIEGLSPLIDKNSLKIKASNGVIVSSNEFSIDYMSGKTSSPKLDIMEDSLKMCQDQLQRIETRLKVNADLSNILTKSIEKNVSGSEKGLNIDELMMTMQYFDEKSSELEANRIADRKEKENLEEIIDRLEDQVDQEKTKHNQNSGILKLSLSAPAATACSFIISYYTGGAGWIPYYDINIASTAKPIKIVSKAKVRQTTGLDWNKVKLTLSTATPSNGKTAPIFNAWFLDENQYVITGNGQQKRISVTAAISNVEIHQLDDPATSISNSLAGVVPGVIARQTGYSDAPVFEDNDFGYISESDNSMNITYAIDMQSNVPGNGKEQSFDLKSQDIEATYRYYCAPKLDTETYLLADIANWQQLNLLSGKANITYDGTYVGESRINASTTSDTLNLTLGTEKRVSVKREKVNDFSSKKTFGNDIKQVFAYKLTVRNNQNTPIRMTLKDQYPRSTQKDITVELNEKETTKPTLNRGETGVITWEEELKAGETKVYQISYSVKYPKNMDINL
mgnify:CR=1 FL=1